MSTTSTATYLSIKEAAERYQKAEITIRRLVRTIVKDAESPHRSQISPTPSEAATLQKKGQNFTYAVSSDLLDHHFSAAKVPAKRGKAATTDYVGLLEETAKDLRSQLSVKDDQIKGLQGAIDALSERQREMHILLKGMQGQVLLEDAQSKKRRWWKLWLA
jgi:Tfp pilus assembly protein FimV